MERVTLGPELRDLCMRGSARRYSRGTLREHAVPRTSSTCGYRGTSQRDPRGRFSDSTVRPERRKRRRFRRLLLRSVGLRTHPVRARIATYRSRFPSLPLRLEPKYRWVPSQERDARRSFAELFTSQPMSVGVVHGSLGLYPRGRPEVGAAAPAGPGRVEEDLEPVAPQVRPRVARGRAEPRRKDGLADRAVLGDWSDVDLRSAAPGAGEDETTSPTMKGLASSAALFTSPPRFTGSADP